MNFQTYLSSRSRPRIELIPMIDVTIFLLVFFMLFTTFNTDETGVEVDLPRAETGTQHVPTGITVSITQSGAIYLEDQLVTLQRFRAAAEEAAIKDPNTIVTIRGDSQSYWEHAVSVMDAARQAGLSRFAFGTQPTKS